MPLGHFACTSCAVPVSYTHLDVYKRQIYNTALYLRLSRDDELQGESGSIQTQRMMLRQYAAEHGLTVVDAVSYTHLDVYKRQLTHRLSADGLSLSYQQRM